MERFTVILFQNLNILIMTSPASHIWRNTAGGLSETDNSPSWQEPQVMGFLFFRDKNIFLKL